MWIAPPCRQRHRIRHRTRPPSSSPRILTSIHYHTLIRIHTRMPTYIIHRHRCRRRHPDTTTRRPHLTRRPDRPSSAIICRRLLLRLRQDRRRLLRLPPPVWLSRLIRIRIRIRTRSEIGDDALRQRSRLRSFRQGNGGLVWVLPAVARKVPGIWRSTDCVRRTNKNS